ncbi:hypothetical protein EYF80_066773 [Liparis tanakae]|uniref:Uncharacterized protein n=1 Tax=Liparis tanakae TaxID=230148 RepID=A0A4Z2E3H5_9TELE|nr:hypothetical protein EYF80_066773 [Liparis tanakae]
MRRPHDAATARCGDRTMRRPHDAATARCGGDVIIDLHDWARRCTETPEGPSGRSEVVSLSETLNPELLPVAVTTEDECNSLLSLFLSFSHPSIVIRYHALRLLEVK